MNPDDRTIADIVDLLPPPPTAALSAAEETRVQDAVRTGWRDEVARERRSHTRRARLLGWGAPALVTACVVAVIALAAVGPGYQTRAPGDTTRPVAATTSAVLVLDRASRAAEARGLPAPEDDQFGYLRSVVRSNEGSLTGPPNLGERHDREEWLTQQPGGTEDGGLIREFGQDWPIWNAAGSPAGLGRPTYATAAALPTDPDELLDEVESQLPLFGVPGSDDERLFSRTGPGGEPLFERLSPDQALFDQVSALAFGGVAPPEVTAALFDALTLIDGVRVDPDARDLLGRPGVGITRDDEASRTRQVLIVDPATGEVIGDQSWMRGADGEVMFGARAVVRRGVADAAGAAPVESVEVGSPAAGRASGREVA